MHFELIKALIRMAGSSPSSVAAELGVSPMTISHVIRGTGTSARVARRIAEVTGKTADELWPGKYPALMEVRATTRKKRRTGAVRRGA